MAWATAVSSTPPPSKPAATLPLRITVMRSAISMTSRSLWEMKITDVPSAFSSRRMPKSSVVSWGVSTAVGSSRMSTLAPR